MRIGIIGAMDIEVNTLQAALTNSIETRIGDFIFHEGSIENISVVVLLSGIGKVSASVATTLLIERYRPDYIINTGTAGGLRTAEVHDLILAKEVRHHDVDVTAFGYEIGQQAGQPATFSPDEKLLRLAHKNCLKYSQNIHKGLVVSGDAFISAAHRVEQILENFPTALAVEMEAAAIAQVCHQFGVPFLILRAISDKAGEGDAKSYEKFVAKAGKLSAKMNLALIKELSNETT